MTDSEGSEFDADDVSALKEMAQRWNESKLGRRKVLATAMGAGLGAAAGGGFLTGRATAQSESAGTIGSQDSVADVYAEDFFDHNGNQPMSLPGDGSVSIDELNNAVIARDESAFSTELGNGGNVTVPTGATVSLTSQVDLAGGCHLHIEKGATVRQADGANIDSQVLRLAGSNVTITFRGTIDLNRQNQSVDTSQCSRAFDSGQSGLTVDGLGDGVVTNGQNGGVFDTNGAEGCTFKNFTVRNYKVNSNGQSFITIRDAASSNRDITVENIVFAGDTWDTTNYADSIEAYGGVTGVVIRENTFFEVPRRCYQGPGRAVDNTVIRPTTDSGVGGDCFAGNLSHIVNNTLIGTGGGNGDNGIVIEGHDNVTVEDNYVRGFSGHGINIAGGGGAVEGVTVSDNVCVNNNRNTTNQSERGEIRFSGDVTGFVCEGNICRGSFDGVSATPNGLVIESGPTNGRVAGNVVTGHTNEVVDNSAASVTVENNVTY